jgi:N utilization substance protein A
MKNDFSLAVTQLAAERNLPKEAVFKSIEAALISACKKEGIGSPHNVLVKVHPDTGEIKIYTQKLVVEEPSDTLSEISLEVAHKIKEDAQLGELVPVKTVPFHGGRIIAQTAKQVVMQRLREAERESILQEYGGKEGIIVSGIVQRVEPKQIIVNLGKVETILPLSEQIRTERYRVGQRVKAYLLEIGRTNKDPRLLVSRTHPDFLRRLFEMEVPEIHDGIVEIKNIAREAGIRSKIAVSADQEGVDPIGTCVGFRGLRIQNIIGELKGEKIDIIEWSPSTRTFIAKSLSPAHVIDVEIVNEEERTALAVVPDNQLSLAIGKEGQNVRLAAKLTGWKIDIMSASAKEKAVAETEKEGKKAETEGVEERVEGTKEQRVSVEVEEEIKIEKPVLEDLEKEEAPPIEPVLPIPIKEVEKIPEEEELFRVPEEPVASQGPQIRFREDIFGPRRTESENDRNKKKKTSSKNRANSKKRKFRSF